MFDFSNLTRFLNPNLGEVLDLFSLAPETVWHAFAILSFLFAVNYLVRTALMTTGVWSVAVQVVVCTLTLLPAILLAGVLVWAAYQHPDRAWINLGVAALLYLPWWAGGAISRLVRRDTEGADVGWMTMGAYITFPAGLIAALIFR